MKSIYQEKKTRIYALHGIGSTRFAIAIANYYCSYCKKKVAVIEAGEGTLVDVSRSKDSKVSSFVKYELVGFSKMKVDYYPNLCYEEILKLLKGSYEVLILDVKDISHDYINLYRMSDKSIFLCNLADYNRRTFCETYSWFENGMVEVEPYAYLLHNHDKAWYKKTYSKSKFYKRIREMRLIHNPNKLTKDDITFLKRTGC